MEGNTQKKITTWVILGIIIILAIVVQLMDILIVQLVQGRCGNGNMMDFQH